MLSTIICIIIVILFLLFQRLKPTDFEQVKAGVAYVASPADHIGRQSRPFRRLLDFSLGGLQKGRTILQLCQTQVKILLCIDKEKVEIIRVESTKNRRDHC